MKVSVGLTAACDSTLFHSAAELVRIFLTCLLHFGKYLIAMRILAIHSDQWKANWLDKAIRNRPPWHCFAMLPVVLVLLGSWIANE